MEVSHAFNTIEKVHDNNNGVEFWYKAWNSLKDWYLNPTHVDSIFSHWESKLDATSLDQDTYATEYMNNSEMYAQKLGNLGENWTDKKKFWEFKKGVSDPDYDTEVRIHRGTFSELIKIVREIEQDLDQTVMDSSWKNKRTRCVTFNGDESNGDTQRKSEKNKRSRILQR